LRLSFLLLLIEDTGGRLPVPTARAVFCLRLSMRAIVLLRNSALLVFFLLLVGGVVLKPGERVESAAASPSATDDGGVYQAG